MCPHMTATVGLSNRGLFLIVIMQSKVLCLSYFRCRHVSQTACKGSYLLQALAMTDLAESRLCRVLTRSYCTTPGTIWHAVCS